ncbi:MAG: hypothetical protein ABIQ64_00910 [Candidatus Saccharimonadales bacterium]
MPFTGTGTGIQNANDIFFSALASNNVLRYNGASSKWNNGPLVVANSEIADGTITETKLSVANTPSLNQLMSWDGSSLAWVTATKSTVGLANVDNTSDVNKPVSTATQTALSGKAATTHSHAIADLPAGSVVSTSTNTRPTSRTDIVVMWTGATDPGGAALSGDVWLGAP